MEDIHHKMHNYKNYYTKINVSLILFFHELFLLFYSINFLRNSWSYRRYSEEMLNGFKKKANMKQILQEVILTCFDSRCLCIPSSLILFYLFATFSKIRWNKKQTYFYFSFLSSIIVLILVLVEERKSFWVLPKTSHTCLFCVCLYKTVHYAIACDPSHWK